LSSPARGVGIDKDCRPGGATKFLLLTKMAGKVFPGDMLLGGHAVSMRGSFVMGREWLCRSPNPLGWLPSSAVTVPEPNHSASTRRCQPLDTAWRDVGGKIVLQDPTRAILA